MVALLTLRTPMSRGALLAHVNQCNQVHMDQGAPERRVRRIALAPDTQLFNGLPPQRLLFYVLLTPPLQARSHCAASRCAQP